MRTILSASAVAALRSQAVRALLASNLREDKRALARVSHSICKMSRVGRWITINSDLLRSIVESTENPSPPEQLDHLIFWLGETQADPGARVDATPRAIAAAGAVDNSGLSFVVSEAARRDLVHAQISRHRAFKAFGEFQVQK
jgi:hypothetical protein